MKRPGLAADERGVVLIEFAIILPFMILIFFGGLILANAMSTSRKATTAVRAMVDIASQSSDVTTKSLNDIMSIRSSIVSPFRLNDTMARISSIRTDKDGVGTVVWSQAAVGARLAPATPYDLPDAYRIPNMNYIVAEMEYYVDPGVSVIPIRRIPLSDKAIMLPRLSQETKCADCN